MSSRGHLFRLGVEGCFIGPQHIILVIDFNRPVQFVDGSFFFLLNGANCVDVPVLLLRRGRQGARRRLLGRWLFCRAGAQCYSRVLRRQLAGN